MRKPMNQRHNHIVKDEGATSIPSLSHLLFRPFPSSLSSSYLLCLTIFSSHSSLKQLVSLGERYKQSPPDGFSCVLASKKAIRVPRFSVIGQVNFEVAFDYFNYVRC